MASKNLEVTIATHDALDVVEFQVADALSSLFAVTLIVRTKNQVVDFDAVVGQPASFSIHQDTIGARPPVSRTWAGIASQVRLIQVEDKGLATYSLTLVPTLWMATQRRNYRIYQQISELDIALKVLEEWGIEPKLELSSTYRKRKYKVQYAESDFAFICRMLEEIGVTYLFRQADGGKMDLVFTDAPQKNKAGAPIRYTDTTNNAALTSTYVTKVGISQKVRPGKYTLRDHDYRRQPEYNLLATWEGGLSIEQKLERYHYTPGAFLFRSDKGDDTPFADDKGMARTDEGEGKTLAQKRLDEKVIGFESNAFELAPGSVTSFSHHPRPDLAEDKRLLILETMFRGSSVGDWTLDCTAVSADASFRPPMRTERPLVTGCESATVVGPKGEEIHVDEFGRVRVHFHWDRYDNWDDNSSCWIHVSQPWAGTGYGGSALPRVGQEVLVEFLGGDPDRPVVVGRVYTNIQKKPYKLPDNKTQSGLRSNSTGGGGGYNELMFEDKAGQELFREHAQKDMDITVENNQTEVVKNNRTTTIGGGQSGDDTLTCNENQYITVKKNQATTVNQNRVVNVDMVQMHQVKKQIYMECTEGPSSYKSKNLIEIISAETGIILKCGDSRIEITPKQIIIQSPHTAINPEAGNEKGGNHVENEHHE
jgi:type VI secretion system secreted protein VgrG